MKKQLNKKKQEESQSFNKIIAVKENMPYQRYSKSACITKWLETKVYYSAECIQKIEKKVLD